MGEGCRKKKQGRGQVKKIKVTRRKQGKAIPDLKLRCSSPTKTTTYSFSFTISGAKMATMVGSMFKSIFEPAYNEVKNFIPNAFKKIRKKLTGMEEMEREYRQGQMRRDAELAELFAQIEQNKLLRMRI